MLDHDCIPGAGANDVFHVERAGAPFVRREMFHVKHVLRVTHDNGPTVPRGTADFALTPAKGTGPLHSLCLGDSPFELPPSTSMF
jgi:hypothetical protein